MNEEDTLNSHPKVENKKNSKHASVVTYLVILFAAAFLLLTLSYFMQQRTNDAISGLQEKVSSFQSIYEKNQALEAELSESNEQIDSLTQQLSDAQVQLTSKDQELQDTKTALQEAQAALDALQSQQTVETDQSTNP